jgi:hypothetical protein
MYQACFSTVMCRELQRSPTCPPMP